MPKKKAAEQIKVVDQVGKRHVVLRYTVHLDPEADDSQAAPGDEVGSEYRLTTGRIVQRTGEDTYQTADGTLRLKAM
ncbi:hypothetical protein LJR290_007290 [Variovorax sp. LjRoot290]|uniref:hypothetical protein n=1 Tax=unclassified Variovorax TaxID=663243 RepID=UPI003ED13B31